MASRRRPFLVPHVVGLTSDSGLFPLEAGFDLVISLVDASVSTESLEEEFTDLRNAVPPKVLIGLLQEFEDLLQPHLRPHPPPLGRPRQKEEEKGRRQRRRRKTPASVESGPDLDFLSKPGALLTPAAAQYVGLSPSTLETKRSRGKAFARWKELAEVEDFQGRGDLRRTLMTGISKRGCPWEAKQAILGHKPTGVTKVYDRYDLMGEKLLWLTVWEQHLKGLVPEGAKVVEINR